MTNIYIQIAELIENGNTKKAIKLVRAVARSFSWEIQEEIIIISGKYERLSSEKRLGILDDDSEFTRIDRSILSLVERMQEEPLLDKIENNFSIGLPNEGVEEEIWEFIRDLHSIEAYQAYINRYPDSTFSAEAKRQIEILKEQENKDYFIVIIYTLSKSKGIIELTFRGDLEYSFQDFLKLLVVKHEYENLRSLKIEEYEKKWILKSRKSKKTFPNENTLSETGISYGMTLEVIWLVNDEFQIIDNKIGIVEDNIRSTELFLEHFQSNSNLSNKKLISGIEKYLHELKEFKALPQPNSLTDSKESLPPPCLDKENKTQTPADSQIHTRPIRIKEKEDIKKSDSPIKLSKPAKWMIFFIIVIIIYYFWKNNPWFTNPIK